MNTHARRCIVTIIASLTTALALSGVASGAVAKVYVTAGAQSAGTTIKVVGTSVGTITFKNITNGLNVTCASSTLGGKVTTGPNQSPTNVGSLTTSTWRSCGIGTTIPFLFTQNTAWGLSASSASTPATSSGAAPVAGQVTPGNTANVKLTGQAPNCTFVLAGSIADTFSNGGTSQLALASPSVNATLSVLSVSASPCAADTVRVGDRFRFTGTYDVSGTNASSGVPANPVRLNAQ